MKILLPFPQSKSKLIFINTLLLLTMVAFCAQTPRAQQTKPDGSREIVQTEEAAVRTLPDANKRFAVLIGVDKYVSDTTITPLLGAGNDAKDLKKALVKYAGFPESQVIVLTSDSGEGTIPVRNTIFNYLRNLKGMIGPDGMLVFAFSGHGVTFKDNGYLLPADASKDDIEDTGIPVANLKDKIKATGAGQVIMILDACRNDPSAGKGDTDAPMTETMQKAFSLNKDIKAFVTLYASEVGQRAYEDRKNMRGYFTSTLIDGLKGEGESSDPATGLVTLDRLLKYVEDQVPRRVKLGGIGREQKPFHEVAGYRTNELVIASTGKVPPPKPAPPKEIVKEVVKEVYRDREVIREVPIAPTTGTLNIVTNANATVRMESVNGGDTKELKANEKGEVSFMAVAPGSYRVASELDGYQPKTETKQVVAGNSTPVNLLLAPITYEVTVLTNVPKGKVTYVQDSVAQVKNIENGRAVLSGLHKGSYRIEVTTDESGYQNASAAFIVPTNTSVEVKLERRSVEDGYANVKNFSTAWTAPEIMSASKFTFGVEKQGVTLLRDDKYQHYSDFQLVAQQVRLTNDVGVSFVVRAVDQNNYYLIQLTGGKADDHYTLRTFIVKDGRARQLGSSVSLEKYKQILSSKATPARIGIKMVGNRLDVTLLDNSDGRAYCLLNSFSDPANSFPRGGVGLGALKNEQFEVSSFAVLANMSTEIISPCDNK